MTQQEGISVFALLLSRFQRSRASGTAMLLCNYPESPGANPCGWHEYLPLLSVPPSLSSPHPVSQRSTMSAAWEVLKSWLTPALWGKWPSCPSRCRHCTHSFRCDISSSALWHYLIVLCLQEKAEAYNFHWLISVFLWVPCEQLIKLYNQYFLSNFLSRGQTGLPCVIPVLLLYPCQCLFSQTKVAVGVKIQAVCKGLQSVNTCEAECIAFLAGCTLLHTGSGRTQWGYLGAVYLFQSSSCSGSESLQTVTPQLPVCFRRVCEKRRRGI